MSADEKTKIIVLEPVTKSVSELLKILEQKGIADIERVSNAAEVAQLALQYQPCVLFINLNSPADIASRVNMIKSLENGIKYGQIKILFASNTKNKQIGNLITSLGVTDYMEEPIPLRTLQFKANIQIKAIATIKKNLAAKKISQDKIVFKKTEQKSAFTSAPAPGTKKKSALGMREDFFLFKQQSPKKVGKKITLEAEGPDPSTGEWVEHESKGDAKTAWRWVPKDEKEKELLAKGSNDGWIHKGDKPQFSDQSQKWQFASEQPSLSFVKDDKVVAEKVATDANGEIEIAEDSPEAEENIKKSQAVARAANPAQKTSIKVKNLVTSDEIVSDSVPDSDPVESPEDDSKSPVVNKKKRSDFETSEIEFNNRTGGLKDKPHDFNNRIDEWEEEDGVKHDYRAKEKIEEEKTTASKARQAIALLKKQKELKKKTESIEAGLEAETISPSNKLGPLELESEETTLDEDKIAELAEAKIEENASSFALKKGKLKKPTKGLDKLKSLLNSSSKAQSEENSVVEGASIEGSQNEEEEEEEEEEEQIEHLSRNNSEEKPESAEPGDSQNSIQKPKKHQETSGSRKATPLSDSKTSKPKLSAKQLLEKKKLEASIRKLEKLGPETLTKEELNEAKKDLGISDSEEASVEEIAKRAKLKKLTKLKEKLLELEDPNNLENRKDPSLNIHDTSVEDPENTWSQKGFSEDEGSSQRGKRNVIDSQMAEEDVSDESKALKKRRAETEEERVAAKDSNFYLEKEKVLPLDGAWERAGDYYIYLSSEIKYRGFGQIEDILPLWVYAGSGLPALLNKTEEWRFQECLPEQVGKQADLPPEVLELLLNLKGRTKANAKKEPSLENTSEETGDLEAQEAQEEVAPLLEDKKARHLRLVTEDQDEAQKKVKLHKLKSKLDSLKSKINDQQEESQEEAITDSLAEPVDVQENQIAEEAAVLGKKSKGSEETPLSSNASKMKALKEKLRKLESNDSIEESDTPSEDPMAQEAKSEIFKPQKGRKEEGESHDSSDRSEEKASDGEESKIAKLKKRLEESNSQGEAEVEGESAKVEAAMEGLTEESSVDAVNEEVKLEVLEEKSPVDDEKFKEEAVITENAKPKPVGAIALEEQLSKKSPNLEKFFAKRKEAKTEDNPASAPKIEKPLSESKANPYLGIMVAISNSFGVTPNYQKKIRKLLATMNETFSPMKFFIVEANENNTLSVEFSETGSDEKSAWMRDEAVVTFEIHYPSGRVPNKLRYLDLKFATNQKQLDEAGTEIVRKVCIAFGTILSQESAIGKSAEEAA